MSLGIIQSIMVISIAFLFIVTLNDILQQRLFTIHNIMFAPLLSIIYSIIALSLLFSVTFNNFLHQRCWRRPRRTGIPSIHWTTSFQQVTTKWEGYTRWKQRISLASLFTVSRVQSVWFCWRLPWGCQVLFCWFPSINFLCAYVWFDKKKCWYWQ